jgi:uncharacterized membrane protein YeaQ/YmgE (transglycosylase-associated protein family)
VAASAAPLAERAALREWAARVRNIEDVWGVRSRAPIKEGCAMNLIIVLVVGGIIGWVASLIMRTDGQQGIILNVVVGIVGALLAGVIVTPLIGGASIMDGVLSIQSILVSLLGSVVLLAIVNLVRRGSVR